MKDQLDRLEDKIDKISDRMNSVDVTLAKQSVILEEHVKRSTMLESRMEPVERHVSMVKGAAKLLAGLGTLAGLLKGYLKTKGL